VRPLYGQGFFSLCPSGILWYTIVFDYADDEHLYERLLSEPGGAAAEVETLRENMQRFLDEERLVINGAEARARVEHVYIDVRGEPGRATATFLVSIPFRPRRGRNVYEDYYEPDTAEYPYTVTWILPACARIVEYEMPGHTRLPAHNVLEVRVEPGTRVPGYEALVFDLSECPSQR
jgi:hypothetical protein